MTEETLEPGWFYWLACECGAAEAVGKPEGRCEGCGKAYKDLPKYPEATQGK